MTLIEISVPTSPASSIKNGFSKIPQDTNASLLIRSELPSCSTEMGHD